MKRTFFAFLSQCLLVIIILTSCSDDQTNLSPDINTPITGYWQIADGDINGDGAIQGIVVHSDELSANGYIPVKPLILINWVLKQVNGA